MTYKICKNMAVRMFTSFFAYVLLLVPIQAKNDFPELLTPDQAEAIVKQRRSKKEASQRAQKLAALGEEALEERILNLKDGQQVVFRRVALAAKVSAREKVDTVSSTKASLPSVAPFTSTEALACESIHLGVNVYGNDYSEITWRDRESGRSFTVWTNVNLNYLNPMTSFEANGIQYDYFGVIIAYSYEAEEERLAMATEQGASVESNWKTPPVVFSAGQYEYFIDAPRDTQVPEKLYKQLDALLGYYLANLKHLEIEYKNARLLQAAQKKDLEENPPKKPKQIIMNYTPLRGEDAE